MAPLIASGKKQESLPKEEVVRLLPQPHRQAGSFIILALLPVIFLFLYIVYPWFTISNKTVNSIIRVAMVIFAAATLYLICFLIKFLYDMVRHNLAGAERDRNKMGPVLLFLFSLMILSTIIDLILK